MSLSLPELTGKLKDGSLQPDAVLYAFMEKVVTAAIFYMWIMYCMRFMSLWPASEVYNQCFNCYHFETLSRLVQSILYNIY